MLHWPHCTDGDDNCTDGDDKDWAIALLRFGLNFRELALQVIQKRGRLLNFVGEEPVGERAERSGHPTHHKTAKDH